MGPIDRHEFAELHRTVDVAEKAVDNALALFWEIGEFPADWHSILFHLENAQNVFERFKMLTEGVYLVSTNDLERVASSLTVADRALAQLCHEFAVLSDPADVVWERMGVTLETCKRDVAECLRTVESRLGR